MTYTYVQKVQSGRDGGFLKLLLIWKASVYKVFYKEFLAYFSLYIVIAIIYQNAINSFVIHVESENENVSSQPEATKPRPILYFENVCRKVKPYSESLSSPLCFVLGFYVNIVVARWWQQWNSIPWPDKLCNSIVATVKGTDLKGRLIRRNLARYINLASIMVYRLISPPIRKRFPEFIDLVKCGYMSQQEHDIYVNCQSEHWKFWFPFAWFSNLVRKAYDENRIRTDTGYRQLIDGLNDYRGKLGTLVGFDWVNISLVYTQVVTIAVHSYFMMSIFSKQYLMPDNHANIHHNDEHHRFYNTVSSTEKNILNSDLPVNISLRTATVQDGNSDEISDSENQIPDLEEIAFISKYLPIYMMLEFLFYMGWLKVAEQLINPFGEDDDDFEMNEIMDRNYEISMRIVDESFFNVPKLYRDPNFNALDPTVTVNCAFSNIFCRYVDNDSRKDPVNGVHGMRLHSCSMDDLSSSKYSIDCRSSSQSPRSQLVTGTDSRMSGMTERTNRTNLGAKTRLGRKYFSHRHQGEMNYHHGDTVRYYTDRNISQVTKRSDQSKNIRSHNVHQNFNGSLTNFNQQSLNISKKPYHGSLMTSNINLKSHSEVTGSRTTLLHDDVTCSNMTFSNQRGSINLLHRNATNRTNTVCSRFDDTGIEMDSGEDEMNPSEHRELLSSNSRSASGTGTTCTTTMHINEQTHVPDVEQANASRKSSKDDRISYHQNTKFIAQDSIDSALGYFSPDFETLATKRDKPQPISSTDLVSRSILEKEAIRRTLSSIKEDISSQNISSGKDPDINICSMVNTDQDETINQLSDEEDISNQKYLKLKRKYVEKQFFEAADVSVDKISLKRERQSTENSEISNATLKEAIGRDHVINYEDEVMSDSALPKSTSTSEE